MRNRLSASEYYSAIQRAINSLSAWRLQDSYGRTMMAAIEDGRCMLGLESCEDYCGNHIPARGDVKDGTKGSRNYVVAACGDSWATEMESVT